MDNTIWFGTGNVDAAINALVQDCVWEEECRKVVTIAGSIFERDWYWWVETGEEACGGGCGF